MNRLFAGPLTALTALVLAGMPGMASAQSYPTPVHGQPEYGQGSQVDYARVIRVDPVLDGYATASLLRHPPSVKNWLTSLTVWIVSFSNCKTSKSWVKSTVLSATTMLTSWRIRK